MAPYQVDRHHLGGVPEGDLAPGHQGHVAEAGAGRRAQAGPQPTFCLDLVKGSYPGLLPERPDGRGPEVRGGSRT